MKSLVARGAGCFGALLAAACGGGWNVVIGADAPDAAGAVPAHGSTGGDGATDGVGPDGSDGASSDAHGDGPGPVEAGGTGAADAPFTEAAAESGPSADAAADGDASAFDPASLPGLVLWLDAASGVTQTAGAVSAWSDRTSNHNDALQPTASLQPTLVASGIGGLPALHFNKDAGGSTAQGAGQTLAIADGASLEWGTGDFYVVVVATSDNTLADGVERGVGLLFGKFGAGTSATGVVLTINILSPLDPTDQSGLGGDTSETAGNWVLTHTLYNDGTPHAFAFQRVGATLDLRVDGASVATGPSDDGDVSAAGAPVQIGSGTAGQILRFDGNLAEVLAVRGALATADRTALEGYVLGKYGL